MSTHSSILGGSNASRLLNCPASYAEQMKSPIADVESVYAAEGTALHAAIAVCVEKRIKPASLLGTMVGDFEIDADRVAVLDKALAALEDLKHRYGGGFKVLAIEKTLALPGVNGAFGSVDLILVSKTAVIVVDWKFGAGVTVKALYVDADGNDYLNPQPAFYTAAARAAHRRAFKGKKIICAIIQPRLPELLDFTETDDAELDAFLSSFQHAFLEALGKKAYRERGDWCRFATCKSTCPLWTGPVFDLSAIDPTKAALVAPSDYGAFLAKALDMATLAETWAEEIRRQAHVYMEDGGRVPNWKVVPKRATRQWIDDVNAGTDLLQIGAWPEDIWTEPQLRSVAQAETRMKKRGIPLPASLYHAVSSGTTIAPAHDPRPNATRGEVAHELREALKVL